MNNRRRRRAAQITALVCGGILAAGGVAVAGTNWYVIHQTRPYTVTLQEAGALHADCALILGARVHRDGRPYPLLAYRLKAGLELYQSGAVPKLLVSGDHGRVDYDEVKGMYTWLRDHGVPAEDIFLDHAGFNTYNSMARAKRVFNVKKVVVVTQPYHLSRAVYDARALGLEAWGFEAGGNNREGQTKRDVREILARSKDWLVSLYQPDPTYLGPVIPIDGSGLATHEGADSE